MEYNVIVRRRTLGSGAYAFEESKGRHAGVGAEVLVVLYKR